MKKVILYTKEVCPLCEDALELLQLFQQEYNFEIEERDIYENKEWLEKYHLRIPVVVCSDQEIDGNQINLIELDRLFTKAFNENIENKL